MAIFGKTDTMYSSDNYFDSVSPTTEGSEAILHEATSEIYKLIGAMYVSDIMIESSVLEGATDCDILVEGTFKDFVNKIIKKLKALRDKIVAWFKKVIQNITIFFMSGEKFVKTYETKILEKVKKIDPESVTWEGYDYAKYGTQILDTITDNINKYESKIKYDSITAETKTDELIEKSYKEAFNVDGVTEVKELVEKEVRGGDSKETLKINASKVSDMITVCKKQKSIIDKIKEREEKTTKRINAFIADIPKETDAAIVTNKTKVANSIITLQQGLNATGVALVKEQYKVFTSVLKAVMTKGIVKESYGDDDTGSSLFESALNTL